MDGELNSERVFIGLGSNLQDPVRQVRAGFDALAQLPYTRLWGKSSLYKSPPLGPSDQPDFVNAVAALDTVLGPLDLHRHLQAIERRQGRRPSGVRWGPRILDLDLLLYGEQQREDDGLTIPHPCMHERAFVLYPLHEVAPDLIVPGLGPLGTLLQSVSPCDLKVIRRGDQKK